MITELVDNLHLYCLGHKLYLWYLIHKPWHSYIFILIYLFYAELSCAF